MRFGLVPVADALGTILAHGVPAAALSKGIVLGDGHVLALKALGIENVTVARLEKGDVGEDDAAVQLANALAPNADAQGVRLTKASTGRVNIMSLRAGLFELDVARITALNRINPMITLATLPNLRRVEAGVMLATIKVIAYALPQEEVNDACRVLGGDLAQGDAMTIRSAMIKTATLIETHHPGQRSQPKGRRVLDARLDRLGTNLVETLDVPHEETAIINAIANAEGEMIFFLTASATSDPNDTAPAALRRAGGLVTRFGMPVDPGNLLFLGSFEDKPVIGLPGCARSPAMNGADWVMERVICGLPIGTDEISAMGVGGLLKDIPERGRPRS
ncbi:molybdopterin-binding protein [Octadecabacter sp. G9-8]|uniref:Molybdopterin-binding protein n=1 Tax=Octadecabacter dasysiphoniae TaxID=2909341 RepID=A0ABS9CWE0_9RHOB|nr:molybdopterin-binding protein [Octadecabacter dasysiphoniae]MCF2870466.1 molybdopterin-binding protein [Octadecabacter dasysiphoniae]